MLPDGDGYTLCRSLHACRQTRDTPVIFLSARAGIDDKGAGFAAGGVDYITKPFEAREVLLRVVNHLGLARRQRLLKERLAKYERLPDEVATPTRLPVSPPPPAPMPPGASPAALRILTRARDYLLKDLRDPPNLAALAAYACTNRTTLGQLFKQHLGMTVFDYLREQRLNEGRRLLAETELAVKVIAEAVGYNYGRDFSNAFKDRFGVTPANYRAGCVAPSAAAGPVHRGLPYES
jgi:AraC-like DNA-binding protein